MQGNCAPGGLIEPTRTQKGYAGWHEMKDRQPGRLYGGARFRTGRLEAIGGRREGRRLHLLDLDAERLQEISHIRVLEQDADRAHKTGAACHDVIARELAGADGRIAGEPKSPKNQIVTDKIRGLGMEFGGRPLLVETVRELLQAHGGPR